MICSLRWSKNLKYVWGEILRKLLVRLEVVGC